MSNINARRTNDTMAAFDRGAATAGQTIYSLRILKDWAANEVASACTDNYRDRWTAERNAAGDAIARLETI